MCDRKIKLVQKVNASNYHKILQYFFQNILKSILELKLMRDNFLDIFQDLQIQKILVNYFASLMMKKSNCQLLTMNFYFDTDNNVHNNVVVILNIDSYD